MTCHGKVTVQLHNYEKSPGLSYVQLSRITSIDNLLIHPSVELERLTTAISKSNALQDRLKFEQILRLYWSETAEFYETNDITDTLLSLLIKGTEKDNTSSNLQAKPPHIEKRVISKPKAKGRNRMPPSNPGTLHIRHLTDEEKTEFRERLHKPGNGAEILVRVDD